jgi:hypothetical protein
MSEPAELHFVRADSPLGAFVDPTLIIEGSQGEAANMYALTEAAIAEHKIGLYLTAGIGRVPAVGYVACKTIDKQSVGPDGAQEEVAVIGGLYLSEHVRGLRLGSVLVEEITARTFLTFDSVYATAARCADSSLMAFCRAGYGPLTRAEAEAYGVPVKKGRASVVQTRGSWAWYNIQKKDQDEVDSRDDFRGL